MFLSKKLLVDTARQVFGENIKFETQLRGVARQAKHFKGSNLLQQ